MTGFGHGLARTAAMIAAIACVLLMAEVAHANARLCRQLEAELSAAGRGTGQSRKYDNAITAQRAQLSKARQQARGAGCGFSFFGAGKERCGSLNATIERMERNLEALQRKRNQIVGGDRPKRARSTILAAIDANGCRDGGDRVASRKPLRKSDQDNGSLFEQLFGGGVRQRSPLDEGYDGERVTRILIPGADFDGGSGGSYRTLCVRACDGYFFPISSASSTRDFERDRKNCEAMCPGTQVELYYHHAMSEESDAMVSTASGKPYSEMPTAYLYKQAGTQRPAGCGCNAAKGFEVIAGNPPAEAAPAEPLIATPTARPDPGADPETLANAEGGLSADALRRMLKPKPAAAPAMATDQSRVRVVGPVFLPDPEGAIDLRAPAQRKVQ